MSDSESEYEYANLSKSSSEESYIYSSDSENSSEEDITANWKKISDIQPISSPQRFSFVTSPASTFLLVDNFDIIAYFKLFFDDSVLDILVLETNRYAEQKPNRSDNQWKHVDKNEIMIFLATNILQSLIKKPEEGMYWLTNEIWYTPVFLKLRNLRRYQSIERNLHFFNNETFDPNIHLNLKLYKIGPIYEIINKKCSSLYIPKRDITIDESLMLYKGRSG
uniref:DDE_Tnp_1_7 domain-containing protein n=1 Tax=Strongyloides papillosus TaxID=174720 RepID=A0A0N5CFA1_STREA